jgi:hypothetical protein
VQEGDLERLDEEVDREGGEPRVAGGGSHLDKRVEEKTTEKAILMTDEDGMIREMDVWE